MGGGSDSLFPLWIRPWPKWNVPSYSISSVSTGFVKGKKHLQTKKQRIILHTCPASLQYITGHIKRFAYPVIWHAFLSSADFFQECLFKKNLSGVQSECLTVWLQIRPDVLFNLIWVLTVCKGYQQTRLAGKALNILPIICKYSIIRIYPFIKNNKWKALTEGNRHHQGTKIFKYCNITISTRPANTCTSPLMKKVNKQCLLDTPRTVRVSEKTWQVIVQTRRP